MAADNSFWVHPTAICDSADIGDGTRVWAFSHVMDGASVGAQCNVGEHVFIEEGSKIGNRVTLKNGVQIWDGITVEDDAFIGPSVVFSNDRYPRSARLDIVQDRYESKGWLAGITVKRGASVGAGAVLVPGIEIGEFAMVAAGAVVTRSVAPHTLVSGCPASAKGRVCLCGHPLENGDELSCAECDRKYRPAGETLELLK